MDNMTPLDAGAVLWRLGATLFFVLLNGFFVAAEFALVKVRGSRLDALAQQGGGGRARMAQKLLGRLDLYLSACQFGITISSLILGWLAEPAVARLIVSGANALGLAVGDGALLHGIALTLALTIITVLHMTLGEQAPKIWALQRPEPMVLRIAYPLRIFTWVFGPLVWLINRISNAMLKLVGVSDKHPTEPSFNAAELRTVLATSAQAGHITRRQLEFADNILRFVHLEVRHIMVPRVDVVGLIAGADKSTALRTIRETGHSRFPLYRKDLDSVLGIVHTKAVLLSLEQSTEIQLEKLARQATYVPDTQPLGRMILELQRARSHCAVVLDEHGTTVGLVFLEDALEEIVGTIYDEFDDEDDPTEPPVGDTIKMRGDLALPEALDLLGSDAEGDDDTIGGHVVSLLGRLPTPGDAVTIGPFRLTIMKVEKRRVLALSCERQVADRASADRQEDEQEGSSGEGPGR